MSCDRLKPPGSATDVIRRLLQSKGSDLSSCDLDAFIDGWHAHYDTEARKSAQKLRKFVILFIVAVASAYAFMVLSEKAPNLLWLAFLAVFVCLVSAATAFSFLLMSLQDDTELTAAEYVRKRAKEQVEALACALALSDNEQGVALLLRSFEPEYKGSSSEEISRSNWNASARERNYMDMTGSPCFIPEDYLAENSWTVETALIETIQKHFQTVILENVAITQSKRDELRAIGVLLVPVIIGDWWPFFLRLADKARIVIVYFQFFSPQLRREIEYVFQINRPYIVICREDTRDRAIHSEVELESRLFSDDLRVITFHEELHGADELRSKLSKWLHDHPNPP